jgi:ornithine cyclodeaminase
VTIPCVTAADVEPRLDWTALADALAEGHRGPRPEIADQFLTRGADTLLTRAAWIDGRGAAVKSVTVIPGNAGRGLPTVHGAMLLFDDATGAVRAVIDSALVTKWKTAGDSVLGARLLARPDARRLLIVGAGAVAASLVEAYAAVFPGIGIAVWNRTPARAGALAAAAPVPVEVASDLADAVAAADIVATATMSAAPVLRGAWLRSGQHLDLIGAFRPDMREADDDALRRASLFVDSRETTLDQIGELMTPLREGTIRREDIRGDLFDLVAGGAARTSPEEITLYKNGGGAHLDLLTGQYILAAWNAGPS